MKPVKKRSGVAMVVAALAIVSFVGARFLSNQVTIQNDYTRQLNVTLNYVSENSQGFIVAALTAPQEDIGSETLASVTLWGQTTPVGQNAIMTDPQGGLAQVTFSGGGAAGMIQVQITASGG